MSTFVVMKQMLMIFILVMAGYLLTKKNILTANASKELSGLVVNVCNPALMFTSIWNADNSITKEHLLQVTILGFLLYLGLVLLGLVIPHIIRAPKRERSHYNMMSIFGNIGFIGYPVITAVLGASGILYALVFNVFFTLLIYTYGRVLVVKDEPGREAKMSLKDIINIGSVSCVLSILMYLTQFQVPEMVKTTLDYMGRSTTFLSMIVIGVNLAQAPLKKIFGDKRVYLFVLVRQVLLPILIGLVIRPFIHDELMYGVTILIMAMPVGNMPLMMAEEAGVDGSLFSRGIIVSTLLSVITIPLVVMFV